MKKRGKELCFLGRIFHFHGGMLHSCAMVSLSMVRAHGPGFTEIQDTHLTLSPQVVPYFGKSPKLGLNQNLGHPLDSFASSPEFWYSPRPGAFALHFHRILENIRVSYIRVNLLRGGYRSLVDFFDTKSSTNLYTNQGSVKNYRGRPDNGYYNNSLS